LTKDTATRAPAAERQYRWADMDAGPNPRPQDLLMYFVRLAEEQPGVEQWSEGAALTRRWIALVEGGGVTETQVTALLDDLARRPNPGSGWLDLWLRVRYWASQQGFDLGTRLTNPWAR